MSPSMQQFLANGFVSVVLSAIGTWSLRYLEDNPLRTIGVVVSCIILALLWFIWRYQPWLLIRLWPTARLTETQLQLLVNHTERLYFAFSRQSTPFGKVLFEKMWAWHMQAKSFHYLFLARDNRCAVPVRLKAINFICSNRQEFAEFDDEPSDTLRHIAADVFAPDEVRRHAQGWLADLHKMDQPPVPDGALQAKAGS